MTVIDFGELNKEIKKVEDIISECNIEERELIIKNVSARIARERQKNRETEVMESAVSKLPFNKLLSKITRNGGEE